MQFLTSKKVVSQWRHTRVLKTSPLAQNTQQYTYNNNDNYRTPGNQIYCYNAAKYNISSECDFLCATFLNNTGHRVVS